MTPSLTRAHLARRFLCGLPGLVLCAGMAVAQPPDPSSALARAVLVKVDSLTAEGRIDEARVAAKSGADRISDRALFARAATFEDRYGTGAPRYFKSLVETLRSAGEPESVWHAAAERGLMASIRERQSATCQWFADILASHLCGPDTPASAAPSILVPGGMRALLYVAGGPHRDPGKATLTDFSRTLTATLDGRDPWTSELYRHNLIEYFQLLSELKAMGSQTKEDDGKTRLRLSLSDPASKSFTSHALNLMGWTVRDEAGKPVVELATESPWAQHHEHCFRPWYRRRSHA